MSRYCFSIFFLFLIFSISKLQAQDMAEIKQPLYSKKDSQKKGFYSFLWGKHYRDLYGLEITAPEITKNESLKFVPITEGYPYFRFFEEFEELYEKDDFEGTYTNRFVADAYTIINPLSFVITDELAKKIGLTTDNNQLYYENSTLYKTTNFDESYLLTEQVIARKQENFKYKIDEKLYVRSRLLDMIVGNSLSVNDSYLWKPSSKNSDVYAPYFVDRGFSFPKKDGLLFGFLLKSLGIKNVDNYYRKKLKTDKINAHNLVYDLTFTGAIQEKVWIEQAAVIKSSLTEKDVEDVFLKLPASFSEAQSNIELKEVLLKRIENVDVIAKEHFRNLQKIVILNGTAQDDIFKIEQTPSSTIITIINLQTKEVVLKNEYLVEKTKEIWLYGLGGIDSFSVSDVSEKNNIVVRIINNDNYNDYELKQAPENIKIYTPKTALVSENEVGKSILHKTDNSNILEYDYNRPKKHTFDFQPGILFDTDLSMRVGGKLTYTRYVFKNSPFSAKHELSWNHYYSLLYSGIYPTISGKTAYTADAWSTSTNHFQNFFGFGNESENYESSFDRDYNRVLLQRTGFDMGLIFSFSETQNATIKAGVERYNIIDEQKFHRDDIFQEGELTDKKNIFLNVKGNYRIASEENSESKIKYLVIPEVGLMVNLRDMNRNVPYLSGIFSFYYYPDHNRKYTIASSVKAKALFNEQYEFYQAATMGGDTGLRGFRNERFSGQQYFVHSNDFRINIGKLPNKVMPLSLETFLGFDYGRVWYVNENSQKWHTSFGGGLSFKVINKFNTNISYFTSSERPRITLSLGYFF